MAYEKSTRIPAVSAALVQNDAGRIGGMRLTFANGQTIELASSQLTNEIMEHAIWHGLKQKLIDAAAIGRDPDTGRSATIDDKYAAVRAVYDRIIAGSWNIGRGEGGGAPSGGYLFRALVRLYPQKSADALQAFLAGKSDKEKAALRKNPRVAAIIEEIKAESAKADDGMSDELLSELD